MGELSAKLTEGFQRSASLGAPSEPFGPTSPIKGKAEGTLAFAASGR